MIRAKSVRDNQSIYKLILSFAQTGDLGSGDPLRVGTEL